MVIFLVCILSQIASSHSCEVHKPYIAKRAGRNLQNSIVRENEWNPIRFHVDWSNLYYSEKLIYEKYIDAAFVYWSNSLKVHRIISSMNWDDFYEYDYSDCDELVNRFKGKIIEDTDMIILVTMEDDSSATYAGLSTGCANDPTTDQPIASKITLNKAYINTESNSEDEIIALVTHQIAHSLGFSYSDIKNFKKPNGESYLESELFTYMNIRGLDNQVFLSTPNVKARAKIAYGCDDLPGIQLENQGKSGSLFNHWEKRMVGQEFMGPQIVSSNAVYSDVTLALFEDSGWYIPDYTYSSPINFGYRQGCSFIENKCIEYQEAQFEEFCTSTSRPFCSSTHLSYGYCYLQEFNQPIDVNCQYFDDPYYGGDPFSDYCPINDEKTDCRSNFAVDDDKGEHKGISSRCFESSFSRMGSSETNPVCYSITCYDSTYEVNVGSEYFVCEYEGQILTSESYSGSLKCPPYIKICYDPPCRNNCYGGKCKNGVCLTGGDSDGFSGNDYPDGSNFYTDPNANPNPNPNPYQNQKNAYGSETICSAHFLGFILLDLMFH